MWKIIKRYRKIILNEFEECKSLEILKKKVKGLNFEKCSNKQYQNRIYTVRYINEFPSKLWFVFIVKLFIYVRYFAMFYQDDI